MTNSTEQQEDEPSKIKFGTKSGQEELADSLKRLKERVVEITTEPEEAPQPSRYTKTQTPDFKISRGYEPAMDLEPDTSASTQLRQDPLDRAPAQRLINEASKRMTLFEFFSPNKIQFQTLKIEMDSAKEAFQTGDYKKASEVAGHILKNLDESFLEQVHDETAKAIAQAYSIISGARLLGLNVVEANRKMEHAQNAFMDDDYSISNRLINEVVNDITKNKMDFYRSEVPRKLEIVNQVLNTTQVNETDKTAVRDVLAKSQSLLTRGNFEEAYLASLKALEIANILKDIGAKDQG